MVHVICVMPLQSRKGDMEGQSSMERSYQRYSDWYGNKFSIKSTVGLDNLQAAAHSVAIFCSSLGSVYISSGGKKVLPENLFSKQSCKIAA